MPPSKTQKISIEDYATQRNDLRLTLCGQVCGYVNFLDKNPTAIDLFVSGIRTDFAEYRRAVSALKAALDAAMADSHTKGEL